MGETRVGLEGDSAVQALQNVGALLTKTKADDLIGGAMPHEYFNVFRRDAKLRWILGN